MVSLRQVSVPTKQALQFVDITDAIAREVEASGVREGLVLLRSRHTTAALAFSVKRSPLSARKTTMEAAGRGLAFGTGYWRGAAADCVSRSPATTVG